MTEHVAPRFSFRLSGSRKDAELVRADEFAQWLSGTLACLRRIQRSSTNRAPVLYRITDLSIGSAVVEIEATSLDDENQSAHEVVGDFVKGLAATAQGTFGLLPYDAEVKRGFRELYSPFRRELQRVTVTFGKQTVEIRRDQASRLAVKERIGEISVAQYAGFIEALNVHKEPVFYLYPVSGPSRIPCVFDQLLLEDVKSAIKRYATVHGVIEYPVGSAFPSRIVAERIELHPKEEELPTLRSLIGAAPNLTDGLDSVTYVRRLRNGEG